MSDLGFSQPFSIDGLGALIGDVSLVAIGENNHHLREFGVLRDELLRYLVIEKGFTVLGFESGFAEGALVDAWIHGAPGSVEDIGRDGFTFSLGDSAEVHEMLRWLRSRGDVDYAGLDLPSSAGSPLPALQAVRAYLADADPATLPWVDAAIAATEPYSGVSSAVAPGRYAALDQPSRDAAAAALTGLVTRMESLRPVLPERDYAVAYHHALGALRIDSYLRELDVMLAGEGTALETSSRDTYMASTLRLLRKARPGAKIVLMLHNGHLQRRPLEVLPGVSIVTAGTHLADEFGDDYFALAVTAGGGTTTGLVSDGTGRLGFRLTVEELGEPQEGSVEHLLTGADPCLLDLRAARAKGLAAGESVRHSTQFTAVDVAKAFDALVYLPEAHSCEHVG
jgi:erythromycin esterase